MYLVVAAVWAGLADLSKSAGCRQLGIETKPSRCHQVHMCISSDVYIFKYIHIRAHRLCKPAGLPPPLPTASAAADPWVLTPYIYIYVYIYIYHSIYMSFVYIYICISYSNIYTYIYTHIYSTCMQPRPRGTQFWWCRLWTTAIAARSYPSHAAAAYIGCTSWSGCMHVQYIYIYIYLYLYIYI